MYNLTLVVACDLKFNITSQDWNSASQNIADFFAMLYYMYFLCSGCAANTRGTAFVVYEDIFDAKNACEHLSGFNVCNRYLVVLYYQPHKVNQLLHVVSCVGAIASHSSIIPIL